MTKINNLTKALAAAVVLAGAGGAVAETVATSASVTVQNTFTLTETSPLSFGTIRAVADPAGTETATVTRPANPATSGASATSGAPAAAQILVVGAPGQYAVSGAASFANLTLTLPADGAVVLTNPTAPPTAPDFILNSFTGHVLSGTNAGQAYAAANLTTDVTGSVNFAVGATLSTDTTASTSPYLDAAYTANFDVIVQYQ